MKPLQAQALQDEYKAMKHLFLSQLLSMRSMVAKESTTSNAKPAKWNRKNPVRQQLQCDVVTQVIPDSMDVNVAFNIQDKYKKLMEFELFKSRLKSMRLIIQKKHERAAEDAKALANDQVIHPRPTLNARGEVQWIDSEAKKLLSIDVAEGLHEMMSPSELYSSCPEYKQDCPILEVFRGHIHQEIKTVKWRKQWGWW